MLANVLETAVKHGTDVVPTELCSRRHSFQRAESSGRLPR